MKRRSIALKSPHICKRQSGLFRLPMLFYILFLLDQVKYVEWKGYLVSADPETNHLEILTH